MNNCIFWMKGSHVIKKLIKWSLGLELFLCHDLYLPAVVLFKTFLSVPDAQPCTTGSRLKPVGLGSKLGPHYISQKPGANLETRPARPKTPQLHNFFLYVVHK